MVERLLSYARCQVLLPRTVDLNQFLAEVRPRLAVAAGEEVEIESTTVPPVRALVDAQRLEAAIFELVANARDALPSGGQIRIHSQTVRPGSDAVTAQLGFLTAAVMISVADNGAGMLPSVRQKALNPFFTTKPDAQGLGLSMVYGFIRQSNGGMELQSLPGEGTKVRLYLPCADAMPQPVSIGGRMV